MRRTDISARTGDRRRAEEDLAKHIKKAVSIDETSPKYKHVRKMIVFTWDFRTSVPVWEGLKVQPLLADEVQCFKALISIHKVIFAGHKVCVRDALNQTRFLEDLGRASTSITGWRGYGVLIHAYVNFLLAKLEYHRLHPEFSGNFDYDEYVSLKTTNDPNEGYETIADLMSLQDRLDELQKLVFSNFHPGSNNECRIASLVPLVEESYGIYKFATRMLISMHNRVEGADTALEELRKRYNNQHYRLRKFYFDCSNLRYLTSLITVPKLPQDPPNLMEGDENPPALPDRPRSVGLRDTASPVSTPGPTEPTIDIEAERRAAEEYERQQQEQQRQLQMQQEEAERQRLEQMRQYEEMKRQQQERERQQLEALQREQLQRQVQGRVVELEQQMLSMKGQHERDQLTIDQYNQRVQSLEDQIRQLQLMQQQNDSAKDELIRQLQAQIMQWRQKYEALAKLYSKLRQEHLELLQKFKEVNLKVGSASETMRKYEKLQNDLKSKNLELADMMRERDLAIAERHRLENSQSEELERLKRELDDNKDRINELSRSKGQEVSAIVAKFNDEKRELERDLKARISMMDDYRRQIDELKAEYNRLKQNKDDEIDVLQASLDQSIVAMAEIQEQNTGTSSEIQERLDKMQIDHMMKLKKILDSILRSCEEKIDETLFDVSSTASPGNTTATPEYVLAHIEKVRDSANTLTASFAGYLTNPEGDQSTVIKSAIELSSEISSMLYNSKGVVRLAVDEEIIESILSASRVSAGVGKLFFTKGQSSHMDRTLASERPGVIWNCNRDLQQKLGDLTELIEQVIPKTSSSISVVNTENVSDIVENQMLAAARAIDQAASRLQALISAPRKPNLSARQIKVNDAILDTAMAMTNAIAQLIRAATACQQEIVAHGRGSSSKAEFYKKNNRWTEGLISAAKAVAVATNLLVETADGVINGTSSLEQMIVASREVTAATAQLVAASRVKSQLHSKTQVRLEEAARTVTDASNSLVKAVKQLTQKEEDEKAGSVDYSKLSNLEFKSREMEQQVEILRLEKELTTARRVLADMRRYDYHADPEEGGTA
ncbi:sla2 Src-like adaptor 2 [Mycoemilia scoparia]|uniref:Sla2 Src-like adaptor 2 n=1 Tax=Mycoemilia scoparia TaxID=417184 RepID=A0A9W7ZXQ5_9FUNG|nr:sla2 Src-like adaptor 2 [Mycoemilia scoparia]